MKQEDYKLLLKDLTTRLPYGVIVSYANDETLKNLKNKNGKLLDVLCDDVNNVHVNTEGVAYLNIDVIRPYLRPLSTMTSDEKMEWFQIRQNHCNMSGFNEIQERGDFISESLDWLNEHMFDYHGLIERGLAIEAPENMYNS